VIIDTAGFDDTTELGERRLEKTKLAAEKTELGIILISGEEITEELHWYHLLKEKNVPVLFLISKADINPAPEALRSRIKKETGEEALLFSAKTGEGMEQVKEALVRLLPENYGTQFITGELVGEEDLVLLVMPQDIQAPKGRLILPQVQTIRELLDKKCLVMSVTTDKLCAALKTLNAPPKLIITDSQVFGYVYENKPKESMLTSFSVLFAAYKGDLPYYMEGAKQIDALTGQSKVLIAECCTHAPLTEDIGRVKLPRMLKKRVGEQITVDIVSGTDFPADVSGYDLIIQCGACMFNRRYVLSRVERAKNQGVPMTNYGVAIAHMTGILGQVATP
jgi:[FeFe] hydrogenase H-cluster maturation GTPase HydF